MRERKQKIYNIGGSLQVIFYYAIYHVYRRYYVVVAAVIVGIPKKTNFCYFTQKL